MFSSKEVIDNKKAEMLLYLDILAYFPELSHGGYKTVGEFISDYLSEAPDKRPTTMFNCFCSDQKSGVTGLLRCLTKNKRLCSLKISADSRYTDNFSSLCFIEDTLTENKHILRDIYVIIGGNYRTGEYMTEDGRYVSSWSDNFLGAVQSETAEQKNILSFFDKAIDISMGFDVHTIIDKLTITVSGHSKAGNLAQYISLFRDEVDECYSFDGQGFSKAFMSSHNNEILKNGHKIINIYPDMSIAGALLEPVPNSRTVFLKTEFLNKGSRVIPLYYHIPLSMLDGKYHLRRRAKDFTPISDMLGKICEATLKTAEHIHFIDAEKALAGIGRAVLYFFKGKRLKASGHLMNKDSLAFLLIGGSYFFAFALIYLPIQFLFRNDQR